MEFKQLRHFVAVVESGNLSRASETLHLTQPALTRSIKNLETQLQAPLLERRPRGVVPTEAGKHLYRYAKLILNETKRATRDVASIASGAAGHVHIGAAVMFCEGLIPEVIDDVASRHPHLAVHVTEGYFEGLVDDLRAGRLDAIVSNFPSTTVPDDVRLDSLITLRSSFVVGSKHPLASKDTVVVDDLKSCRLAMIRQPHVSDFLAQFFGDQGLSTVVSAVETNSIVLLKALVLSGNYVSLLPEHVLIDEMASGAIKTLTLPGSPLVRKAGLIVRNLPEQRPQVDHVIDAVRRACAVWGS